MNIAERLECGVAYSDWGEAFGEGNPPALVMPENESESVAVDPFTRGDVVEIYGISEGENDEDSWVLAGRLLDGRHFYLTAWCDYTGWD